MARSNGCHHVALLTADLDRCTEFYQRVFEAEVRGELDEEGLRHALIHLGGGFHLHPFELLFQDDPESRGSAAVFQRGHIDHLAIDFGDSDSFEHTRQRLVDIGASDGAITDFGMIQSVSFEDPDGMEAEIAIWSEGPMLPFGERVVHQGPVRASRFIT